MREVNEGIRVRAAIPRSRRRYFQMQILIDLRTSHMFDRFIPDLAENNQYEQMFQEQRFARVLISFLLSSIGFSLESPCLFIQYENDSFPRPFFRFRSELNHVNVHNVSKLHARMLYYLTGAFDFNAYTARKGSRREGSRRDVENSITASSPVWQTRLETDISVRGERHETEINLSGFPSVLADIRTSRVRGEGWRLLLLPNQRIALSETPTVCMIASNAEITSLSPERERYRIIALIKLL